MSPLKTDKNVRSGFRKESIKIQNNQPIRPLEHAKDGKQKSLSMSSNSFQHILPLSMNESAKAEDQEDEKSSSSIYSSLKNCAQSIDCKDTLGLKEGQMTDLNSLYRKLYNRDLTFFCWVIDQERATIYIKLHIQAQSQREFKPKDIRRSVIALLPRNMHKDNQPNIQIQFFTKKKQFKVFLEFQNSDTASKFFSKAFGMKKI